ncbi:MAG: ATP-binding protein [Proteobacteria bacterium]|nr:ATP-binding protein [Pseudomonadota bacterium]
MGIEELLSQKEGKTLEFKRDLFSFKPIIKTLVAFANTAGGTLMGE